MMNEETKELLDDDIIVDNSRVRKMTRDHHRVLRGQRREYYRD